MPDCPCSGSLSSYRTLYSKLGCAMRHGLAGVTGNAPPHPSVVFSRTQARACIRYRAVHIDDTCAGGDLMPRLLVGPLLQAPF